MYEIPLTVGLIYRGGVRRQLRETGLTFKEDRGFLESRFVIQTSCKELHDLLREVLLEDTARQVLH